MPRLKPPPGSVFQVPLNDGTYIIGQVIAYEPRMLNSVICVFSNLRDWSPGEVIPRSAIIAAPFTTYKLLTKGRWKVIGTTANSISQKDYPFEHLRSAGWVGASMVGTGVIEELMNAWFGLTPWDDWADPNFLDGLLFGGRIRPECAIFKTPQAEQFVDDNPS